MQSEINHHLQLLEIYKQSLADLLRQQAIHGSANTPTVITFSIRECRENINSTIKELKKLDPETFQNLVVMSTDDNEDYILVDHVVNEFSIAYNRYVMSVKERLEKINQEQIEASNWNIFVKYSLVIDAHEGHEAWKKYLLETYPKLLVEHTETQRSVFISEISLILLKSGLPLLNNVQTLQIKDLITPTGKVTKIPDDPNVNKSIKNTLLTGIATGAIAGSIIPGFGTVTGALAGALGSTLRFGKVQMDRELHYYRLEIKKVTNEVVEKLQETEFSVINNIVRHCIVR